MERERTLVTTIHIMIILLDPLFQRAKNLLSAVARAERNQRERETNARTRSFNNRKEIHTISAARASILSLPWFNNWMFIYE